MSRSINVDPGPRRSCPSRPRRIAFALRLALTPLLALPLSASAQNGLLDIGALRVTCDRGAGVSTDGSVVVGHDCNANGANPRAFRWTSGGGMVDMAATKGVSVE